MEIDVEEKINDIWTIKTDVRQFCNLCKSKGIQKSSTFQICSKFSIPLYKKYFEDALHSCFNRQLIVKLGYEKVKSLIETFFSLWN